jgi:1-phosphofructokinase
MIYTITLNPSLDYYLDLPKLKLGTLNRATDSHVVAAGKGINVSVLEKASTFPSCSISLA